MARQVWAFRILTASETLITTVPAGNIFSFRSTEKSGAVGSFTAEIALESVYYPLIETNHYIQLVDTADSNAEYFYGIIKAIKVTIEEGQRKVQLTGKCLLEELNEIRVAEGDTDWAGHSWASPEYWAPLSETVTRTAIRDDDENNVENVGYVPFTDLLYIGHSQPFSQILYDNISYTSTTGNQGDIRLEAFFQGEIWRRPANITDGTDNLGNTMEQDGAIQFDDYTGTQMKETHAGLLLHWVRHGWFEDVAISGLSIGRVRIWTRVPGPFSLSNFIAHPSATYATNWGWTDVAPNTGGIYPVMMQFFGDTLIGALSLISEKTGGFFHRTTGRTIGWIRRQTAESPSCIPANAASVVDFTAVTQDNYTEGDTSQCVLTGFEVSTEAIEATRLRVFGSGTGNGRITLEKANDVYVTLPAGYSIDYANSVLINGTAETNLGRSIEKDFQAKDISAIGTSGNSPQVSSALLGAAAAALSVMSSSTRKTGKLRVVGVRKPMHVMDIIRVQNTSTRSGSTVYSIDEYYRISEMVQSIDSDGRLSHSLTLVNEHSTPTSGTDKLGKRLQSAELSNRYKQTINVADVDGANVSLTSLGSAASSDVYTLKTVFDSHASDTDAHHAQQHDIFGSDHTASGTTGQAVGFTGTNALGAIDVVSSSSFTSHENDEDAHHDKQHTITDSAHHLPGAGTTGQFLQRTSSSTVGWASVDTSTQQHDIVGSDHTLTASQYQIVGATATNTLGLLTPRADGNSFKNSILRSDATGDVTLAGVNLDSDLTFTGSLDIDDTDGDVFTASSTQILAERHLRPDIDSFRALGSNALRWSKVWADDAEFTDDVIVSDTLTVNGGLTMGSGAAIISAGSELEIGSASDTLLLSGSQLYRDEGGGSEKAGVYVPLSSPISHFNQTFSTVASYTTTTFSSSIPSNAVALHIDLRVNESTAIELDYFFAVSPSSTYGDDALVAYCRGPTNWFGRDNGILPILNTSRQFVYRGTTSGTNSMTVVLRILGYFI